MMPFVFTDPVTVLSAPMVILPAPVAEVVTAGTSWSPVSFTATSSAFATPNAAASTVASAARRRTVFMSLASPCVLGAEA
jgi:hypothetical protein